MLNAIDKSRKRIIEKRPLCSFSNIEVTGDPEESGFGGVTEAKI